jgi:acyl transferase domain-containing protein
MPRSEFQPIAIIGYGCLFPPNSYDADAYWENLISGKSGISTPPPERWTWERYYSADRSAEDKTYCNLGGFIKDYRFPYAKFGLSENDLPKFNRTQLMILDATLQAVEMSGYGREDLQELTTGLFVGNMLGDEFLADYSMGFRAREVFHHMKHSEKFSALPIGQQKDIERGFFDTIRQRFPIPKDVDVVNAFQGNLAKSVGNYLGLSGALLVCDAACASGLLIVHVALKYLQDRSHDLVLACGVMGNMSVTGNVSFAKIGGLSETHSAPSTLAQTG